MVYRWFKTKDGSGPCICGDKFAQAVLLQIGVHPTVFQLEIIALMECAQKNTRLGCRDKEISIYSNSQATVKAHSFD